MDLSPNIKIICWNNNNDTNDTNNNMVTYCVDRQRISEMYPFWRSLTEDSKSGTMYDIYNNQSAIFLIIKEITDGYNGFTRSLEGLHNDFILTDKIRVDTWLLMYEWGRRDIPSTLLQKLFIGHLILCDFYKINVFINHLKKVKTRSGIFNFVHPLCFKEINKDIYLYLIGSYLWEYITDSRVCFRSSDNKTIESDRLVKQDDRYILPPSQIFFTDDIEFLEDILFCLSTICFKIVSKNTNESKEFDMMSKDLKWVFVVFDSIKYSSERAKREAMYERYYLLTKWYKTFRGPNVMVDLDLYEKWIDKRKQM